MVYQKRKALGDITAAALSGTHPYHSTDDEDAASGKRQRAHPDTAKPTHNTQLLDAPRRVTRRSASLATTCPSTAAAAAAAQEGPAHADNNDDSTASRRLYSASVPSCPRTRTSSTSTSTNDADQLLACDEALALEEPALQATLAALSVASSAKTVNHHPSSTHSTFSSSSSSSFSSSSSSSTLPPGIVDIDDTQGQQQLRSTHYSNNNNNSSSTSHTHHQLSLGNTSTARGPTHHPAATEGTPQRLAAYSRDYFTYLREREREQQDRPMADYLARVQRGALTQDMRALLIDWLVTVCEECELMPSTLYHCVELVDRALSKITVAKEQLQCLGCACLFVACKFEETTVPPLEEFTYMAAESFTKKQLTDLELRVVEGLSFRVSTVTAYNFLPRFTLAAGSRSRETALVHYLSEVSLLHYEFLAFPPSIRAAAALYLARQTLAASTPDPTRRAAEERNVWTPTIEYYTGYAPKTDLVLQRCVKLLRRAHAGAEWSTYEALKIKYTEPALLHVGEIACLEEGQLGF